MKNFYGEKGVKKKCDKCGYYVYLCPDVIHNCPICNNLMEILVGSTCSRSGTSLTP